MGTGQVITLSLPRSKLREVKASTSACEIRNFTRPTTLERCESGSRPNNVLEALGQNKKDRSADAARPVLKYPNRRGQSGKEVRGAPVPNRRRLASLRPLALLLRRLLGLLCNLLRLLCLCHLSLPSLSKSESVRTKNNAHTHVEMLTIKSNSALEISLLKLRLLLQSLSF